MKWFFLFLFPFSLFASLNSNNDFQIWNVDSMHMKLTRSTQFNGAAEFRYGNNRKKLYYKHYQGGISFCRSPHTLLQGAYRHVFHRLHGKWEKEPHPFVELTFQTASRRGLYLGNRNRIAYRFLNDALGGHNRWLYRNRSEFIPPIRLSKRSIAPFVSYELFWQETRGIDQQRIEGGFKIPYHQRTQLKLSYVLRFLKDSQKDWIHQNVIWIHFSLHF